MTAIPNPAYDPNDALWAAASNPGVHNHTPLPTYANHRSAIITATAPSNPGYANFLTYEARKSLIDAKLCGLARFIESLYFMDFKSELDTKGINL